MAQVVFALRRVARIVPLLVAVIGMGCGSAREATIARQQARIDTLASDLVALRVERDSLRRQLDATLVADTTQHRVADSLVSARVDSLLQTLVLQFVRGRELTGALKGRTLGVVYFEPGSATVTEKVQTALNALAPHLKALPDTTHILVEGHSDDTPVTGSETINNRVLSAERASAVVQYLVDHWGLPAARFETAGYGADRPLVPNDSASMRRINRRVRIAVFGGS